MLRHQPPVHSPLTVPAVARALLNGDAGDPRVRLAELLRSRYEAAGVLLTDSGTSALRIALSSAAVLYDARALIALPAFGCFDLATAALGAERSVTLYDIDPDTLAPDPDSLEHALRAGARIVVVAPFCGYPVPWEALQARAAAHGAILIEDAAQGHGASWRGKPLGSLATLSVLSFGRGKGWTGGGGGALLWRGAAPNVLPPGIAARSGGIVAKAIAQAALARPTLYGLPAAVPWLGLGDTVYRTPRPPRGMARAAAAIALATRAAADIEAAARRQRAAALSVLLAEVARFTAAPPDAEPGFLRLPMRPKRDVQYSRHLAKLGVARTYPITLARLAPLAPHRLGDRPVPGAEEIVRTLLTVPTHGMLRPEEARTLLDALR